jgi:cytochrome b561
VIAAIGTAWLLVGTVTGLVISRGVRIADEREGHRPARLDPRAGQHATRAAHGAFTVLLVALVLVGVGIAQQSFGGAA